MRIEATRNKIVISGITPEDLVAISLGDELLTVDVGKDIGDDGDDGQGDENDPAAAPDWLLRN